MMSPLELAAVHESGHAVAAVLRGGSSLNGIRLGGDGHGFTAFGCKPIDVPFMSYAGPWAEARAMWPTRLALDAEDEDGLEFGDYVFGVLLDQPRDRAYLNDPWYMPGAETRWHDELEQALPAIRGVAADLLVGAQPTQTEVERLLGVSA